MNSGSSAVVIVRLVRVVVAAAAHSHFGEVPLVGLERVAQPEQAVLRSNRKLHFHR